MAELSGEFSRRQITSPAGALRREARRQERYGNFRGADQLSFASSQAKLQNPGFASSEEQTAIQRYRARNEDAVSAERRRYLAEREGMKNQEQEALPALPSVTPRLDRGPNTPGLDNGPSTPGLDSNPVRPTGSSLRQQTQAAPAGSKLLSDRQELDRDIQEVAAINGDTGQFLSRAKDLGVAEDSFRRRETLHRDNASLVQGPPKPQYIPPGIQAEDSPLVKQATAIQGAKKVLDTVTTAPSIPTSFSESAPVSPVGGQQASSPIPSVGEVAQPPTFEQLTPARPQPATPPQMNPSGSALRQQVVAPPVGNLRDANPVTFYPSDRRKKDQANASASRAYDDAWNRTPDIGPAPDSVFNRAVKTVRARLGTFEQSKQTPSALRAKAEYDALPLEEKQRRARAAR